VGFDHRKIGSGCKSSRLFGSPTVNVQRGTNSFAALATIDLFFSLSSSAIVSVPAAKTAVIRKTAKRFEM
jgi:hypothetical protein